MAKVSRRTTLIGGAALAAQVATPAFSQAKKYDDGISDTEIKIGHTGPQSGVNSSYAPFQRALQSYWAMVNANGGINGRKITFIAYDDAFIPPKTVELTRRLVEQDKVALLLHTLGTVTSLAIRDYVNQKKVPHLFVGSGASKWGDYKNYPWSIGWQPNYRTESNIYTQDALKALPDAKIAVLTLNDDSGRDWLNGVKDALGKENEKRLVQVATYEATDPTVDSQVIQLKESGATVFMNMCAPKAAAQAIKKAGELGWKPRHYVCNISSSAKGVLQPAGLDYSQGMITAAYLKDMTDKQWDKAPDAIAWGAWMDKFNPQADKKDFLNVLAYACCASLVEVLKRCGAEMSRANIMKQVANLRGVEVPLLLPGIKMNTSPTDFFPIEAVQMQRFKGEGWELFGAVLANEST